MSFRIASGLSKTILLFSAVTAAAAGCAGSHSAESEPPATAVFVWPDTVTINERDTLRLRVLIRDSNRKGVAPGQHITWTIGDSSIARVYDGLITAGRTGSTTVTAIAEGGRGSAHVEVVR